jgi:hypothetical protein
VIFGAVYIIWHVIAYQFNHTFPYDYENHISAGANALIFAIEFVLLWILFWVGYYVNQRFYRSKDTINHVDASNI